MAAVITRGLCKSFEQIRALDGVDVEVAEGEVRGLLGPNGAGKTTLLRVLLGLVRRDSGTVELLGQSFDPDERLDLSGVSGFVEEPSFYPYLSGRANLEVLAQLDGGASKSRIAEALERVELAGRAGERVSVYSTGMRQRLGLAAALLRAPRLLLLDEPTAGLDPAGVRLVGELVRDLADSGVAVLLSSHQTAEVEAVCDSFTVISRGRVAWDGSAEQMRLEAPPSAHRLRTSDDARTLELAAGQDAVRARRAPGGALIVEGEDAALDGFVLALGRAGVAVRSLELQQPPLEAMFFALTGDPEGGPC
jgi:ABC-2 type transport system ATP-binding protein